MSALTWIERTIRTGFRFQRLMMTLLPWYIVGISIAIVYYGWQIVHPTVIDYGDALRYPDQIVTDTVPGIAGPAVHSRSLGLHVQATKCNDSKAGVTVHGEVYWVATYPPGFSLKVSESVAVRKPGCATTTYVNAIPASVASYVQALAAQHIVPKFIVRGIETPVDGGHAVTWQTETFTVVP